MASDLTQCGLLELQKLNAKNVGWQANRQELLFEGAMPRLQRLQFLGNESHRKPVSLNMFVENHSQRSTRSAISCIVGVCIGNWLREEHGVNGSLLSGIESKGQGRYTMKGHFKPLRVF